MRSVPVKVVPAFVCAVLALSCGWFGGERAAIKERLTDFTERVNTPAPEGLGSVGRAAEIAGYFTDDVVVELGEGTAPISGRETLMAMAIRLQPRLSDYVLKFADANIRLAADEQSAEVNLTAEFIRRNPSGRQSMDAREFKLGMRKVEREWKIARVTAVDTLK